MTLDEMRRVIADETTEYHSGNEGGTVYRLANGKFIFANYDADTLALISTDGACLCEVSTRA